jgi:hypothetical protein
MANLPLVRFLGGNGRFYLMFFLGPLKRGISEMIGFHTPNRSDKIYKYYEGKTVKIAESLQKGIIQPYIAILVQ